MEVKVQKFKKCPEMVVFLAILMITSIQRIFSASFTHSFILSHKTHFFLSNTVLNSTYAQFHVSYCITSNIIEIKIRWASTEINI
jgi:hypothetical protein